jgi:putative inorganic carbon (hco3(-)) transporter
MIAATEKSAGNTGRGRKVVLTALPLIVSLVVFVVAITANPPAVLAAVLLVVLLMLYTWRLELGVYALVVMLPFRLLERQVGGVVGISPLDAVLWPWLLVYGIRLALGASRIRKSAAYGPLAAYVLAVALSGLAAAQVLSWLVALVSSLAMAATFILTFSCVAQHPQILKRLIHVHIGMSLFVAVLAMAQRAGVLPAQVADPFSGLTIGVESSGRIAGLLTNSNILAAYLSVALLITLGLALGSRGHRRSAYFFVSVPLAAAIVLTFSRSGFLACASGVGVLVFAGRFRLWKSLASAAAMVVLVWGLMSVHDAAFENTRRAGSFTATLTGNMEEMDRSTLWRLTFGKAALDMVGTSPVIGIGAGQFMREFPNFVDRSEYSIDRAMNAHNTYLQVLAETGLLGLASLLLFLVTVGVTAFRAQARAPDAGARYLVLGLLASGVGLSVLSVAHNMIRSEIWLIAGLTAAASSVVAGRRRHHERV